MSQNPRDSTAINFSYDGIPGPTIFSPINRNSSLRKTFSSIPIPQQPSQSPQLNNQQSQQIKPIILESGPPLKIDEDAQPIYKYESSLDNPYKPYKLNATRYEVDDIPDAKEEEFRSGCCGKSPVTYESEEKKRAFC